MDNQEELPVQRVLNLSKELVAAVLASRDLAGAHPSSISLERSDSLVQAGPGRSERRTSLTGQGGSERRTSLGGRRTSRSSLSRRLSIRSGGDETERTALLDGSDGETDSVFSPESPREVLFE